MCSGIAERLMDRVWLVIGTAVGIGWLDDGMGMDGGLSLDGKSNSGEGGEIGRGREL